MTLEKEKAQKQLIQERNLKNEIHEKYLELEKKFEDPNRNFKPKNSPKRKDQVAEKLKKEKFELKSKYDLQSAQVVQLQKKVQQMENMNNYQKNNMSRSSSKAFDLRSGGTSESVNKTNITSSVKTKSGANHEDKKKVLELTKTMGILVQKEEKAAKQADEYK